MELSVSYPEKSLGYRLGAYKLSGVHFECEVVVETTIKEVGQYLEQQAKLGTPITYTDVSRRFPDLPMLTGAWRSHPLCGIFGELDDEDNVRKRPFRTALVFAKETGRPGQGFFDTVQNLRGTTITKSEQDRIWTDELKALIAHYA